MKHILLGVLFFVSLSITAQIFEVENIKISQHPDKTINLVILSEGYQTIELPQFKTDAIDFKNALFSQSPFSEYTEYFNVYIIKVPSNESGADHPGTSTNPLESSNNPLEPIRTVDTYFNATFDSYGYHRLLYYEIDGNSANNTRAKIYDVLANNFPAYDQALILVNSTIYGGSGGEFPIASKGSINGVNATEIAIHELGHSLFYLKDEYYPLNEIYFAEAINMTQESNPNQVKWKNWLGENGVGIYQYNPTGYAANWYRPHQSCKMQFLGYPFCSVCKEGIIEKIHSLVSPIDSYSPTSTTINNPSFPIDFQLNLIKTNPNTLESTWSLNTSLFDDTNVDTVSILETDLNAGINYLTAVVIDGSALLRVDNHETTHVYTVNWTIDNSALGVKNITSDVADFNISMFPNPSQDLINFKFESDKDATLKIEIISLDGKKIKTVFVSNYQITQVDISNLSTGIYLTNFYSGNMLLANKKLVKN